MVWKGFAPLSLAVSTVVRTSASGLCGPHGAVAVGGFSLDHAGPQLSLRAVVGGLDLAGMVAEGQKLVSRAPDFGLQLARQVALRRRAEHIGELIFQRALFAGDRRGFETGDVRRQIEDLAEPQLEAQGQIIRAMLQRKSRVARQMRQTGLMRGAMILLRGITIREPHLWNMAVHRLFHDAGAARTIGLMHARILAVKHPMPGVGSLDPHTGFVAGDNPGFAKDGLRSSASILNRAWERMNMFISAPSLTISPKASRNRQAQALIGKRLKALQINKLG